MICRIADVVDTASYKSRWRNCPEGSVVNIKDCSQREPGEKVSEGIAHTEKLSLVFL